MQWNMISNAYHSKNYQNFIQFVWMQTINWASLSISQRSKSASKPSKVYMVNTGALRGMKPEKPSAVQLMVTWVSMLLLMTFHNKNMPWDKALIIWIYSTTSHVIFLFSVFCLFCSGITRQRFNLGTRWSLTSFSSLEESLYYPYFRNNFIQDYTSVPIFRFTDILDIFSMLEAFWEMEDERSVVLQDTLERLL